jgi:LacI family transcriptional regulator
MKKSGPKPRTPQVALLIETSTEYGRGLLRGIVRYSRHHGLWSLYLAPSHLEKTLPNAGTWHGDGIIARIRSSTTERILRESGVPFVASNPSESCFPKEDNVFGEIRTAGESVACMAATHLAERGLRHFAYCGFSHCQWSAFRERAFVEFLKGRGFSCATYHVEAGGWLQRTHWIEAWEHEQPIVTHWLRALPKPVGIMACNDVCGREVLQACATAGLHVPDDVAVIGVDNDDMMCELSSPPLSSIALDLEKAGYAAAGILDHLMRGRRTRSRVVFVRPTHVATRRSTDFIAQDDPVVATALRIIRDDSRLGIGVPQLVERVGVPRRTLERRFARAVGRSILGEITGNRIEQAKRLLLETDLACYKVGMAAGFGSVKSFTRTFRQNLGCPPERFRTLSRAASAGAKRESW